MSVYKNSTSGRARAKILMCGVAGFTQDVYWHYITSHWLRINSLAFSVTWFAIVYSLLLTIKVYVRRIWCFWLKISCMKIATRPDKISNGLDNLCVWIKNSKTELMGGFKLRSGCWISKFFYYDESGMLFCMCPKIVRSYTTKDAIVWSRGDDVVTIQLGWFFYTSDMSNYGCGNIR